MSFHYLRPWHEDSPDRFLLIMHKFIHGHHFRHTSSLERKTKLANWALPQLENKWTCDHSFED